MDDARRVAADLARFLDLLLEEVGPRGVGLPADASERVRWARRERLASYVGSMTHSQRLRLAGALHLLAHEWDDEIAHPGRRIAAGAS